jgi:glutamyl-tRNA synthetase
MKDSRKQSLMGKVRTRVAPSPTGLPHVGTALQALLNWVYARRYDGKFALRIEDTDRKRFVEGSEEAILDGLDWIELTPDESVKNGGDYGPYRQSERLEIYQQYARQLVDEGKAYHCFCSSERLAQMRKEQQKKGIPPKYDRHCCALAQKEIDKRLAAGEKYVIRLKVPDNQEIVVQDSIRGQVKFDSKSVDDQVLVKSDGFPTYHLAVVVDDHLMGITHMLRGEEWLPSAPKQVIIYQYLGWEMPVMIHLPTLRNPDKSKLSKRKGHTSMWWYREQGYLPEALLNFLALLVWLPKNQQEFFSKEEMMEEFEWEQIKVTGPIFDAKKLSWMNGNYIRKKKIDDLFEDVQRWVEWVAQNGTDETVVEGAKQLLGWMGQDLELFKKALNLAQDRLKILSELPELLEFYFEEDLKYDDDDLLQKHSPEEIKKVLLEIKNRLGKLENWTAENWEETVRKCADDFELKHKVLFMSMRSAVTAKKFTPPLYEVMEVLGHKKSLERIERAVEFLG